MRKPAPDRPVIEYGAGPAEGLFRGLPWHGSDRQRFVVTEVLEQGVKASGSSEAARIARRRSDLL